MIVNKQVLKLIKQVLKGLSLVKDPFFFINDLSIFRCYLKIEIYIFLQLHVYQGQSWEGDLNFGLSS